MAWADRLHLASSNNKTSSNQLQIGLANNIAVGEVVVVVVATDNVSTTDGQTTLHSTCGLGTTIPVTQSLTKAIEFTNGQGAAAGGATVSIWYGVAENSYTAGTDTLIMEFSSSITAKAVTARSFTIDSGSTVSVQGTPQTLANDAADAGSIAYPSQSSAEYLWLRGGAVEGNGTTYTASTNFTAFTHTSSTTSGGGSATNMGARGEFRIFTGTTQTTDPTTSAVDQASVMVALKETAGSPPVEVPFPYTGGGYYGG